MEGDQFRSLDVNSLNSTRPQPTADDQPSRPSGRPPVTAYVGDRILDLPPAYTKPVPPTYEEAVNTGRVIRESGVSAVCSPRYGGLVYPCDHNPSQVCYNCIETLPRRTDGPIWRVRRTHSWPFRPQQPIWVKIAFFLLTLSFFIVIFSIIYNLLVFEAFFWYDSQAPSTPKPWHSS